MSQPDSPGPEAISPAAVLHLDRVCDRFEAAWKAGHRPQLEDHLSGVPELERSVLLRELIAVELHYRSAFGERTTLLEYQRRFPDQAEMVDSLFRGQAAVSAQLSMRLTAEQSAVSASETSSNPARLGRYRITGRIGSGNFGVVFQGRDDELRR